MYTRLKSIAEIKQGYSLREALAPNNPGDISIIQPKDLKATGELDLHNTSKIMLSEPQKHFLKTDEVLFVARGRYAATVFAADGDYIASSLFLRLTVTSNKVLPEYLAAYLNSPSGMRELHKYTSSSIMPAVTKAQMEEFNVPLIPLDMQARIAQLTSEYNAWRHIHTKQAELTALLINTSIKKIIGENNG